MSKFICTKIDEEPEELPYSKISFIYANEADVLNMAMFGITAKEWRDANPDRKLNQIAIQQMTVLETVEGRKLLK